MMECIKYEESDLRSDDDLLKDKSASAEVNWLLPTFSGTLEIICDLFPT